MKHGHLPECGFDYIVKNGVAQCGACGEVFKGNPKWELGAIVRYTSKAAKSIFGSGALGMPKNGRIVGFTDTWPIVEWCDGNVSPVAEAAIELKR